MFRNAFGITVVLPDHGAKPLTRPLIRAILRELGLSLDEYHRLLDE